MMPDLPEDLLAELMKTFQVEAVEHVQTLNQSILQLERLPQEEQRRELVQNALRAAHSLKGAARAVDSAEIEALSHSLEHVLEQAHKTTNTLEPAVCDVLYLILDGIQKILNGQMVDIAALQSRLSVAFGSPVTTTEQSAFPENAGVRLDETVLSSTEDTIRVAISKLDSLMAQTGELVTSKTNARQRIDDLQDVRQNIASWPKAWREMKEILKHVQGEPAQRLKTILTQHAADVQRLMRTMDDFEQSLNRDVLRLDMVTADLQEDVRRTRMLPFQTIVLPLERSVRDAARTEGKQVAFVIEGRDVEIDKKVLETLKDPLQHLLRNAVSHGIKPAEARLAAGKSAEGLVQLVVRQRGSEISLTVIDDGEGFDLAALRQAAHQDTVEEDQENSLDSVISLAFLPGISTADEVTAISGRGIGLDVVRQQIGEIHGRIAVNHQPGQGASIELIVPSSVTMTRGLMVRCGNEKFVLPLLSVERIMEIDEVLDMGERQMIRIGQSSLIVVSLAAVLERPVTLDSNKALIAVIVSVAEQRMALLVDEVLSELELTVKPLGEPLRRVRNIAGAALMGNGEPVVVLNPGDLFRSARHAPLDAVSLKQPEKEADTAPQHHILVVDDSITTRTLEKNILEAAGYRVTIAINGVEALKRLKEHSQDNTVDLVVTDIQMPIMDGIGLTRQIRDLPEYQHLPVILVTSLEHETDREKGMQAGADAYIVKRGFNQSTLLATIQKFLEG